MRRFQQAPSIKYGTAGRRNHYQHQKMTFEHFPVAPTTFKTIPEEQCHLRPKAQGKTTINRRLVAGVPRTVNGTGHTGPSEFCATSI